VVIPAAGDARKHADFSNLLEDKPLCMLQISGKSVLQHQAELFRSMGVTDIHAIGGYKRESIRCEGVTVVPNPEWAETHVAHSILKAAEKIKGKCLVAYADILFDRQILNHLLKSPHAVTLVIDRAYKTLPTRNKALELVITENPAEGDQNRRMALNMMKPVRKIGKNLDRGEADCEFTGIALFQAAGLQKLCEFWKKAQEQFKGQPFYEAVSVDKAALTDLLQYMIDQGVSVYGVEVEHGWSEIHSREDYLRVSEYFKSIEAVSNAL
jgi:choline kinase